MSGFLAMDDGAWESLLPEELALATEGERAATAE